MEATLFTGRLALRSLRRGWTYALAAVAMLALALTLNVTVFSIMDSMLFRGFPQVKRNDQLVFLQEHDRAGRCCISYADARDWQQTATSFDGMALIGGRSIALRDANGRAMDLRATTIDANLFGLLGVSPSMGRDFVRADAAIGAPPVVLLSHRIWQSRFAGRQDVIGSSVHIDGTSAEIIGVMPEGFEFPEAATDGLWMPIASTPDVERRGLTPGGFTAVARLRDGFTIQAAREELETINRGLAQRYPDTNQELAPTIVDYAQFISGDDARMIWGSMWAAAWLVLLIACANVANLTLVRAVGRRREFTTCLALGAGRGRLVRQILTEGTLIAIGAGGLAWLMVRWCVGQWAAVAASPYQIVDYGVHFGTVVYLAATTVVAAVLLSLGPVAGIVQLSAAGTLKGDARGVTYGRHTKRLVTALVAGQMALAIVLLAGAGVLVRSFANIVGANTGVRDAGSVLVGRLRLPSATYPTAESRLRYLDQVVARLRTISGVEKLSLSNGLPVKFASGPHDVEIDGVQGDPADGRTAFVATAPHYFSVLGDGIIAGRDFTEDDRDTAMPVAIVNQRFASLHWLGQSPLGKRIRIVDGGTPRAWRVVVGMVANIMNADALRQQFKPMVYVPLRQELPGRSTFFLARVSFPVSAAVREQIAAIDSDVRLDYFDSLGNLFAFDRDNMDAAHSELGKYSRAAPIFSIVALLLATTGLVAVIAHSVSQRTKEIGIRIAIGAAARDITRLILTEAMRPLAIGLVLGLAAALAVNRVLQSQLVGVSPDDPLVLAAVAAIVVLVTLVACRIPVRRALRVAAAVALRDE
jgi:putative ABC transport system permease protein